LHFAPEFASGFVTWANAKRKTMSDTKKDGSLGDDIDLSQFYEVFFEEAGENLDLMETMLLNLNVETANDEELNGIFRCAHSVKGGAATFGFADVAGLTHRMESLLDRLRRHEIQLTTEMVDVLLLSADASRSLLARRQAGGTGPAVETGELVMRIEFLASGEASEQAAPVVKPAAVVPTVQAIQPQLPAGVRQIEIKLGPLSDPKIADLIVDLFKDIPGLGSIEPIASESNDHRNFSAKTDSTDNDLLDLFTFHVARELIEIREIPVTAIAKVEPVAEPAVHHDAVVEKLPTVTKAPAKSTASSPEASTIRVGINKVDQLINLVGELVITQAMLAQNSKGLDAALHEKLMAGLADLDRNTRDLQESVMSIRMIPMSIVFSRFPRMLRDLAGRLNKKVDFVTHGEATELDKGLVEKITDPLTHLIRNSCDHGIESPAERLQAGKPEMGTITLSASHQGGSIVIEVKDDGKGLSRSKILSKARERGLDVSDQMTDAEVWQLIFAPGFSTAEAVTDVSGRGVGMDVVKRNITDLNGTVEIESLEGQGMKVAVRLPLTLAIMDAMSVGVGGEVYILPLSSVVESFQVKGGSVNTVAQGSPLIKVRDEYMPVIELENVFQVPRDNEQKSDIMVVVEADGSRVVLLVDELLGQQQVVVKNLESNYRKVKNVSGATIMGDGKVALILDTAALVRRSKS
jgi:two-component system, chemotaxis family, sensor kinase CheA